MQQGQGQMPSLAAALRGPGGLRASPIEKRPGEDALCSECQEPGCRWWAGNARSLAATSAAASQITLLAALSIRCLSSHSSGDQRSKIEVWAGLVFSRAPSVHLVQVSPQLPEVVLPILRVPWAVASTLTSASVVAWLPSLSLSVSLLLTWTSVMRCR